MDNYVQTFLDWNPQLSQDAFDINVNGQIADVKNSITSSSHSIGIYASIIGTSTADLFNGNELNNISNVGKTIVNETENFINNKISALTKSATTLVPVTVGSIIGDAAGIAKDPKAFTRAIKDKAVKISNSLVREYAEYMSNSSALTGSLSNLGAIKSYAAAAEAASTVLDTLGFIFRVIEPILPVSEITADLALSFWSGGTSTVKAANGTVENAEKLSQKLLSLACHYAKEFLFSIKIPVPSIIVGFMSSLNVRESVQNLYSGENEWLQAIFNDSFYNDVMSSLTWGDAIQKALGDANSKLNDWSNLNFGDNKSREQFLKDNFMASFTKDLMTKAIRKARQSAKVISYTDLEKRFNKNGSGLWIISSDYELSNSSHNVSDNTDGNVLKPGLGVTYSPNSIDLDVILKKETNLFNGPQSESSIRLISSSILQQMNF